MKRFIITLSMALFLSVVLFSCKSGIEKKAEKQLRSTMLELAKNPDTFDITDMETRYCTDSLCIIQCRTKGQNGFGGYSTSIIEYIYLIDKDKRYECVSDLEDENSILPFQSDLSHLSKQEAMDLYSTAALICAFQGREVPDRKK